MKRSNVKIFISIWLLCLSMGYYGQIADAKDKLPLRVGYLPILTQMPIIVSYENDRMNFTKSRLEIVRYKSFTSLEAALRVGAIEIAAIPMPVA